MTSADSTAETYAQLHQYLANFNQEINGSPSNGLLVESQFAGADGSVQMFPGSKEPDGASGPQDNVHILSAQDFYDTILDGSAPQQPQSSVNYPVDSAMSYDRNFVQNDMTPLAAMAQTVSAISAPIMSLGGVKEQTSPVKLSSAQFSCNQPQTYILPSTSGSTNNCQQLNFPNLVCNNSILADGKVQVVQESSSINPSMMIPLNSSQIISGSTVLVPMIPTVRENGSVEMRIAGNIVSLSQPGTNGGTTQQIILITNNPTNGGEMQLPQFQLIQQQPVQQQHQFIK